MFYNLLKICLLYTSDAADEGLGVDLGGRRIIKITTMAINVTVLLQPILSIKYCPIGKIAKLPNELVAPITPSTHDLFSAGNTFATAGIIIPVAVPASPIPANKPKLRWNMPALVENDIKIIPEK